MGPDVLGFAALVFMVPPLLVAIGGLIIMELKKD
jgi:hypothetical protein